MNLIFYNDPGHGWLAVPPGLLEGLGLAGSISCYSYVGPDGTVYLEEDCDAPKLLAELRSMGIEPAISERITNGQSFIRGFPGYVAPKVAKPRFTTLAANCIAQQQASLFEPDPAEFALA